ncbi:MAG: hypothetical protein NUV80_04590 [Candidatus Berkelbacteria bacterium]|nr:hypothetical protein [Candidatus Berkelbacteria bacterium]
MKKLIDFPDVVLKKVEMIRDREGHKTFTAALFSSVSQYYDHKYFSKHKGYIAAQAPELEPELTPEQYCEQKGGRVETVNGVPMCILQISKSMQRKVPLSSVHTLLK